MQRARGDGANVTAYNLGVRRETAADVERRWLTEVTPRVRDGDAHGLILAIGVNDTAVEEGERRLPAQETLRSVERIVAGARLHRWPLLVVGPALVAEPAHNERILALSADLSEAARDAGVSFVGVAPRLVADETWLSDVLAVDGAHPTSHGYMRLADIIWPAFSRWLWTARAPDVSYPVGVTEEKPI